jgi:hypothetical protein
MGYDINDGLVLPVGLRQVRRYPPLPDKVPEIVGVQVHAERQSVGQ